MMDITVAVAPRSMTARRGVKAYLLACSALCAAGFAASSVQAQTNCFADDATLTCSTDHSGGILVDPIYDTLVVEGLTEDVGVDGGTDGIRFDRGGAVTATITTGDFAIRGEADGTRAIHLSSFGGDHPVTLTLTGDASSATSDAILATSAGDVTMTITGDVRATDIAIRGQSFEFGGVNIALTGTAQSDTDVAISASAPGAVVIGVDGTVTANGDAILASSFGTDAGSTVTITAAGTVTSWNNTAISATSSHQGVSVTSTAILQAKTNALEAISTSGTTAGTVTVSQTGNVTSDQGAGIFVQASGGSVSVQSAGRIVARDAGIDANTTGALTSATVAHEGNITSYRAAGVDAQSSNGAVSVSVTGDIVAQTDGVRANTTANSASEALDVTVVGDITAYEQSGIEATSSNGGVTVSLTGDIIAKQTAIIATSSGGSTTAEVSVTTSGGRIESYDGYGIQARSAATDVTVTNGNGIIAKLDGIRATMTQTNSLGSGVTVGNTAAITSYDGYGIYGTATEAGVSVTNSGALTTKAGGIYATATGDNDFATVTVTNTADIATFDGSAIFARSSNEGVTVSHDDGLLSGGSYGINAEAGTLGVSVTVGEDGRIAGMNTAAIRTRSITGTTITNRGTVDGGEFELAILSEGFGGTTVHNYGTLIGSLSLENGDGFLTNHVGGFIAARDLAFTGGGLITNDGVISAGGDNFVATANFGANFVQSSTGVLRYDVTDSTADLINVSGNVELEGGVLLAFDGDVAAREIILVESWWVDLGDLTLLNAAVAGEILYRDTQVVLDYQGIDFAPAILASGDATVGGRLNAAYEAGSPGMSDIFTALIGLSGDAAYQDAIRELSPEIGDIAGQQMQLAGLGFSGSLMSCPAADGETYRAVGQSACYWASASLTDIERDAGDPALDYDATRDRAGLGVQMALEGNRFLGFGIGTLSSEVDGRTGDTSDIDATEIGGSFKIVNGPLQLAAALSYSTGDVDTVRRVTFGGIDQTLTATRDIDALTLLLRAAHQHDLGGSGYIKSGVDLSVSRVSYGAGNEGVAPAAVAYASSRSTAYGFAPSVEVGGFYGAGAGWTANPFLRVGGFHQTSGDGVSGDFLFSDAGQGSFTLDGAEDLTGVSLSAGVNLLNGSAGAVNVTYTHDIADDYRSSSLSLKGMLRF